jgi:hypothetical protein
VGHVKADRIPAGFSGQNGFSMSAVAKGKAFGRSFQVAAEYGPEHPTGDDKVFAVSLKTKLLRPRLFIRSQVVAEALNL